MSKEGAPEVWLRGSVAGIPPLLQPVAHALLQAREEVATIMQSFDEPWLWQRPGGAASAAFHLQHLTGVLDRLFTYARGKALTAQQLAYLAAEGKETAQITTSSALIEAFNRQVNTALQQLAVTDEATLTMVRGVGRAQLPSTVIGLLVHTAEHTQRHVGQLLVTVKVLALLNNDPETV